MLRSLKRIFGTPGFSMRGRHPWTGLRIPIALIQASLVTAGLAIRQNRDCVNPVLSRARRNDLHGGI